MRFTLIIPVFNAEPFIVKTLETVFRQVAPPDEIIIIDDGSTDQSNQIIKSWIQKRQWNDRVRLISQSNQGAAAARNTGINAASGDIVSFLDADDHLKKNHFAVARSFFELHPIHPWFSTTSLCDHGSSKQVCKPPRFILKALKGSPTFFQTNYFFSSLFNRYYVNTDTVFIKRQELLKIPLMDTTLKVGEDQDLWFRFALIYPSIGFSPKGTVRYQRSQNPNSLMNATESRLYRLRCVNQWLGIIETLSAPLTTKVVLYLYISTWRFPARELDQQLGVKTRKAYQIASRFNWVIDKMKYFKKIL